MNPTLLTAVIACSVIVIALMVALCHEFVYQCRPLADKLSRARARVAKLLAKSGKLFDLPEVEYREYGTVQPPTRSMTFPRMILEYMEGPLVDIKSFRALIDTSKGTYRCANVTMLTKDLTPGEKCVSVTFSVDTLVDGWVNGFAILNERGDCMQKQDFEKKSRRLQVKAKDTFHFTYHMKN